MEPESPKAASEIFEETKQIPHSSSWSWCIHGLMAAVPLMRHLFTWKLNYAIILLLCIVYMRFFGHSRKQNSYRHTVVQIHYSNRFVNTLLNRCTCSYQLVLLALLFACSEHRFESTQDVTILPVQPVHDPQCACAPHGVVAHHSGKPSCSS